MKRFLVVSLAVLALAAVVPQPAAAGFGIKGGLSQSNISLNPSETLFPLGNLNHYTGGIFWGFNLGFVTIQPEALYVRMGTHMQVDADWLESRLEYIQIPVLLKLNLLPGPIKPVVYGGGYYSFLLSAKGVSSAGESEDLTDIRNSDYGAVLGGGLDFNLAAIKISLEARYNLGMANINDMPEDTTTVKNKGWMFLVGLSF